MIRRQSDVCFIARLMRIISSPTQIIPMQEQRRLRSPVLAATQAERNDHDQYDKAEEQESLFEMIAY